METYTLNTTDYDYRILQHEGFGGICKYIATPKKADRPKLAYQARKHTVCLQCLYG